MHPKFWITVAHVYKNLWTVEEIFRTTNSIFETRPIYHKRDETIRGHVFCSFLALLLKQELESRMKRADLQWEWAEVIRGLDNLQQVEANFQGRRFLFRSQLTAHASQAVCATGVALPPTLREIQ
jgi:transposase